MVIDMVGLSRGGVQVARGVSPVNAEHLVREGSGRRDSGSDSRPLSLPLNLNLNLNRRPLPVAACALPC